MAGAPSYTKAVARPGKLGVALVMPPSQVFARHRFRDGISDSLQGRSAGQPPYHANARLRSSLSPRWPGTSATASMRSYSGTISSSQAITATAQNSRRSELRRYSGSSRDQRRRRASSRCSVHRYRPIRRKKRPFAVLTHPSSCERFVEICV